MNNLFYHKTYKKTIVYLEIKLSVSLIISFVAQITHNIDRFLKFMYNLTIKQQEGGSVKKRIIAFILFFVLLIGSCVMLTLIKSEFGRLPLFFLTQENVRKITLTRNGIEKGSTETITLSEREKMIFISMYSKKLRVEKNNNPLYSLKTVQKANKAQGKITEYFTVYLKPFGKIKIYSRYYIGGLNLTHHDEYEDSAMTASLYLYYIGYEEPKTRYYGVYYED